MKGPSSFVSSSVRLSDQVRALEDENFRLRVENDSLRRQVENLRRDIHAFTCQNKFQRAGVYHDGTIDESASQFRTDGGSIDHSDLSVLNVIRETDRFRDGLEKVTLEVKELSHFVREQFDPTKRSICEGGSDSRGAPETSNPPGTGQGSSTSRTLGVPLKPLHIGLNRVDVDHAEERKQGSLTTETEEIGSAENSPNFPQEPLVTVGPESEGHMIPVRARKGSRFVDIEDGRVRIQEEAIITPSGPDNRSSTMMGTILLASLHRGKIFLGIEYEDKTCLRLLPIRDTRVLKVPQPKLLEFKKCGKKAFEFYGTNLVHVTIPLAAYRDIIAQAKERCQEMHPETHVVESFLLRESGRLWFQCGIQSQVKAVNSTNMEMSVTSALSKSHEDLVGDSLLTIKLSQDREHPSLTQVRLQLWNLRLSSRDEESRPRSIV